MPNGHLPDGNFAYDEARLAEAMHAIRKYDRELVQRSLAGKAIRDGLRWLYPSKRGGKHAQHMDEG